MPALTPKQIRDAYRQIEKWGKDHPMARQALGLLANAGVTLGLAKATADKHDGKA